MHAATRTSMIEKQPVESRQRCPECLAVFRSEFACCPVDGAALGRWTNDVDPLIGSEIAERYVIEELVGEGAMGLIYRARHVRLPRIFAIKILFGDLVADPRMRMRFAQEASLASRLNHPNVVPVVDFGRSDRGLLYLVMDYVEGEVLGDLIAREAPLDPLRALRLTRELLQGLAHAHETGMVHRDFKPGNVVMEWNEEHPAVPRILDFGLAISTREREQEELPGRLTEFGFIVGTPIYIAPEQALDHPVDHRADLFALGVVLYEMLAGKPPFDGKPVEIAHKNVSHPVPRIAHRSPGTNVPWELERVMSRLLEKSPDNRFSSAAEVIDALDDVEQGMVSRPTQGMVMPIDDPTPWGGQFDETDVMSFDHMPLLRPRGGRLVAIGAGLLAFGAVVWAVADHLGFGSSVDGSVKQAAAAESPAPAASPAMEPASPPAIATQAAPAATEPAAAAPAPEVTPLKEATPHKVEVVDTSREAREQPDLQRRRSAARERAEDRERAERRAEAREAMLDEEEEEEPPDDNFGAVTIDPALAASNAPKEASPPAPEPAPAPAPEPETDTAPAGNGSQASVNRLVREYREVGEAIASLQARRGDGAARRFRERYFRLPYGDALRIDAVRRDTLAALEGLRQEVLQAARGGG